MLRTSGIYKIINLKTGDFYIGSATSLYVRKGSHWSYLRNNKHGNRHLQNAVNKYGLENFEYMVIEECSKDCLINREQYYIDLLKPHYNICLVAGSTVGRVFTEEHKKKISDSNRGKKRTPEQIEHQRLIKLGKKHSDETKQRISEISNSLKGTRIGDRIAKDQIIMFSVKFNNDFDTKTLKTICRENGFNYRSVLKFVNNKTFKEYYHLLNPELLKDINNFSKTRLKNEL